MGKHINEASIKFNRLFNSKACLCIKNMKSMLDKLLKLELSVWCTLQDLNWTDYYSCWHFFSVGYHFVKKRYPLSLWTVQLKKERVGKMLARLKITNIHIYFWKVPLSFQELFVQLNMFSLIQFTAFFRGTTHRQKEKFIL